ncbi:class I SAM-dependent methyltransferase [Terasakiella pusilla]|uniref:class I SAM-dependent methyltransferase n=1 Tax=Terasakiella pusilla TaxID=64973 RepID=UPI003AA95105
MKSAMYSTFADEYDLAIQDNIYNAHLERPSLQALLPDIAGLNILDLGCGSGVYAEYLLDQGANHVTSIDYSADMIQLLQNKMEKRQQPDKTHAYVQDLSLGLPQEKDASADLVIAPLMIHYLKNLHPLFEEVHRVLKTNGMFVFSSHHPFVDFASSSSKNYFATEKIQEEWHTLGRPVEVTFYRRPLSDIMNALAQSGLLLTHMSEGQVSQKVKTMDEKRYQHLTTRPNFLFIQSLKGVE